MAQGCGEDWDVRPEAIHPFLYLARNNSKCLEELGAPGGLNGVGIRFSVVQELVQKCNNGYEVHVKLQ